MNLTKSKVIIPILILLAIPAYGFDFQAWAKEQQKKWSGESKQTASKPSPEKKAPKPQLKAPEKDSVKADSENTGAPSLTQPVGESDIQEIQDQIRKITEQTKIIDQQGISDRANLQKVLQQVQIQKKLVDTLKVPKQPIDVKTVNADEMIRRAKIRIIAEDVRRTQEALKASKAVTSTPKPVKIAKATER